MVEPLPKMEKASGVLAMASLNLYWIFVTFPKAPV